MGEVYLAQDTRLDRKVALKILPADVASNRDRMERFVREAKAAAALNHPNIAHIYEIGSSPMAREGMAADAAAGEQTHFIAMEFIDGVTLREAIHKNQAEFGKLLRYLQQVAEGLAKACGEHRPSRFEARQHNDLERWLREDSRLRPSQTDYSANRQQQNCRAGIG